MTLNGRSTAVGIDEAPKSDADTDAAPTLNAPATLALTDKQAAALLGVSQATWRRWVDDGRAPTPMRIHKSVRWWRPYIEAWAEACQLSPSGFVDPHEFERRHRTRTESAKRRARGGAV